MASNKDCLSTGAKPKVSKRKVYEVPSRYLQTSESGSSGYSIREKSPSGRSKEVSKDSSQEVSGFSKLSISSQGSLAVASTPLCKEGFSFPDLNASVVTSHQGHLAVPSVKQKLVPALAKTTKKNLMKEKKADVTMSRPVTASQRKKNDSFNEKLATAKMDIYYAEYLQSVFLKQQARIALEERASNAVEKLHKLLTLVQMYLEKVKSRKAFLKVISTVIDWHNHCQKQHAILKPVFEVIPSLEKKYKSLAEAIEATKHKLPIENVTLPESDIQELLQKMEEFLSSYFKEISNCEAEFLSSSEVLKNYVVFGEILTEELKRCVTLLTDAQEKCFSEALLALGCKITIEATKDCQETIA